jgi:hypothetical protein
MECHTKFNFSQCSQNVRRCKAIIKEKTVAHSDSGHRSAATDYYSFRRVKSRVKHTFSLYGSHRQSTGTNPIVFELVHDRYLYMKTTGVPVGMGALNRKEAVVIQLDQSHL